MYATRNSLFILALLLIVGGAGYWWYGSTAEDLQQVKKKNQELKSQLRGALEVSELLTQVQAQRDSMFLVWQNAPKKILNTEEPAFSLSYINWLVQNYNLQLDFDFYLNEKTSKDEFNSISYTLNGEGSYRDICSLIWLITHNTILYQIQSVTFKRSDRDAELLNFIIKFEGYSIQNEWDVGKEVVMAPATLGWESEFSYDAFDILIPAVVKPEPVVSKEPKAPPKPVEPPGLIDVTKARLIAITNDQAYLRDSEGKVVPLKVGSRVRRGTLSQIDQQRNQVEFTLRAENGSSRLFRLNLEYN